MFARLVSGRDRRSAPGVEGVVHADEADVDAPANTFDAPELSGSRSFQKGGRDGPGAHEQMVVLDADRPARRESKFKPGADRATPACCAPLINDTADRKIRPKRAVGRTSPTNRFAG